MTFPLFPLSKLGLVLVAAYVITGCGAAGSTSTAPTGSKANQLIERQIKEGIARQLHANLDVSCPPTSSGEKGATFHCSAKNKTTKTLRVDVVRVDIKGNVRWKMKAINTNFAETDIRAGALKQRQSKLAVLCPDVIGLKAGSTFTCHGTDENGTVYPVTVTQIDDKGNITWAFDRT